MVDDDSRWGLHEEIVKPLLSLIVLPASVPVPAVPDSIPLVSRNDVEIRIVDDGALALREWYLFHAYFSTK